MCEYVDLRNEPHHPNVARWRIANTAAAQKKVGDYAAPASSSKLLTCTTKTSLYVPPEATTNGAVQLARNSQLPIWHVLRTID